MRLRTFVPLALFSLVACSKADDSGSSAAGGAGTGGQSADVLYAQAASHARDDIACQSDADCCVVFDNCHSNGYVVGLADRDAVAGILEDAAAVATDCTMCMNPAIEVSCSPAKVCTAVEVSCPQVPSFYEQAAQDHCDSISIPAACGAGDGAQAMIIGCGT